MVMSVQVHEKTYRRDTWEYHTVDSWYLATPPEHYHTHICHIKTTINDQFTDIVHFSHKKLTRPTVTHENKIMAEILDCAKATKNLGNGNGYDEMKQLV